MILNKITIIGNFLLLSTLQCFGMEPKDQLFINAALLNTIAQEAQQVLHDEETALEVNATDDETALGQENASKKRRYECPTCKKSVANLTQHMRIHTGEKPFHCDQCNYSCTQSSHLIRHKRTHTDEKPFHCNQCNYSCASSSDLTKHILIHTGEKPYHCDQCNYSSTQKGNLTTHKRTHSGEKPFSCNQCNYSCAASSSLKKHTLTHTGGKPLACDQYNYSCTTSNSLKKHNDLQMPTGTKKKDYKWHQAYADAEKNSL